MQRRRDDFTHCLVIKSLNISAWKFQQVTTWIYILLTKHYRAKFKNLNSNAFQKRPSSKNWTRTWTLEPRKKDPLIHGSIRKTEPLGLKYYWPNLLLVKLLSTKIFLFPVTQGTTACSCSFKLAHVPCTAQKFCFSCLFSVSCIALFWPILFYIRAWIFLKTQTRAVRQVTLYLCVLFFTTYTLFQSSSLHKIL